MPCPYNFLEKGFDFAPKERRNLLDAKKAQNPCLSYFLPLFSQPYLVSLFPDFCILQYISLTSL